MKREYKVAHSDEANNRTLYSEKSYTLKEAKQLKKSFSFENGGPATGYFYIVHQDQLNVPIE